VLFFQQISLIDHGVSLRWGASYLLDHDINLISVLHVQVFGGVRFMDTWAVKEESNIAGVELY